MGDTLSWGRDQEARAEAIRYEAECKERIKNLDPVVLDSSVRNLLDELESQQLTAGTFRVIEKFKAMYFKK